MGPTRRSLFVTGTDTGVGKTLITAALLRVLREGGHCVAGMKPIAAGSMAGPEGPANEDALLLQAESSARHPYGDVNPWLFEPAVAPHIAAAAAGIAIDLARIAAAHARLAAAADVVLAEGAGGFLVPLDAHRSCAEIPALLRMDVILVVGLRLGCLNHALLTVEAIAARGLALAGWVGNHIDPGFARMQSNVDTLAARIAAPCLGIIPHMPEPDVSAAAARLADASRLLRIPLE
ncbi:MAG TPA: dethiobiotin synthase [Steroidobacteraceae bacterium]|nr:dethiobiotin synthase [Steroidobacteraceae bacterium]